MTAEMAEQPERLAALIGRRDDVVRRIAPLLEGIAGSWRADPPITPRRPRPSRPPTSVTGDRARLEWHLCAGLRRPGAVCGWAVAAPEVLAPVLAVVGAQQLAYGLAMHKGLDPGRPFDLEVTAT